MTFEFEFFSYMHAAFEIGLFRSEWKFYFRNMECSLKLRMQLLIMKMCYYYFFCADLHNDNGINIEE